MLKSIGKQSGESGESILTGSRCTQVFNNSVQNKQGSVQLCTTAV